jgi:hypothetical protein
MAKTWNAKKHGLFDASLNAIILAQIQAVFDAFFYTEAIWARSISWFVPKVDSICWAQLHTIYDAKTKTIISPQLDAIFDA